MMAYIIRRLLYGIPIVLGVALIVLALFHVAGGDPVELILGKNPKAEARESLIAELGLDKPILLGFPSRFTELLRATVTFDYGNSYSLKRPVRDIFVDRIGPTLLLSFPAFMIGAMISIVISLFVAFYRGSFFDHSLTLIAIAGISLSSLLYVLYGQAILAHSWHLFPVWGFDFNLTRAMVFLGLPSLIWVSLSLGADVRYFRTVVLDQIRQDYVRTARSIGHTDRTVLFRHVLRNCLIPVVTRLVIQVPFLITGSFLLEIFFGIPGLGTCLYTAIAESDFPILSAFTMIGSILYVLFNILSDVTYAVVDPRVRLG